MKKMKTYLAYAGAIPFMVCTIFLMLGFRNFPVLGAIEKTLIVYTLVIASFMAGSHWGQHFNMTGKWTFFLPVLSNIMAIVVWLAFLCFPFDLLIMVLILNFFVLLLVDYKLLQANFIEQEYFNTRCWLTCIVNISLLLSWAVA